MSRWLPPEEQAFVEACAALEVEQQKQKPQFRYELRIVRYDYDEPYYAVEAPSGMQLRRFYDSCYLP